MNRRFAPFKGRGWERCLPLNQPPLTPPYQGGEPKLTPPYNRGEPKTPLAPETQTVKDNHHDHAAYLALLLLACR